MSKRPDLYQLLPAVYRIRDAERGYPLQAILEIIGDQADIIRQNIDQLGDDLFVETCADWLVPYIGSLIGWHPLHDAGVAPRADVAKTIYYRRRKGMLPMLEEVARDVTGWPTRAVAYYELLGWTQNLNHLRYDMSANPGLRNPDSVIAVGTANLRDPCRLELLDGPFDALSHTVDVRPFTHRCGRHGIRRVGFHQWRLRTYRMEDVPRIPVSASTAPHRFIVSPLGNNAPLFTNPEPETGETTQANEANVPTPIRRLAFHARTEDYYGEDKSLAIYEGAERKLVDPASIRSADHTAWRDPPEGLVAVDVATGRVAFHPNRKPSEIWVDYVYGFSGDIGGGPYDRQAALEPEREDLEILTVGPNGTHPTLQAAITAWSAGGGMKGLIRIEENASCGITETELPDGSRLVIESANGRRPTISSTLGVWKISTEGRASIHINGLLIQRGLVLSGDVQLSLDHCTLVPGRTLPKTSTSSQSDAPSISVPPNDDGEYPSGLTVEIASSIVGRIQVPDACERVTLRNSIVDGLARHALGGTPNAAGDGFGPAPPTSVERCTLLGPTHVRELTLGSETLFVGTVTCERRQSGCVRFSYVPPGSQTPRRYRCQPDLAWEELARQAGHESTADLSDDEKLRAARRVAPAFTSIHYGQPGYGQLAVSVCREIRTGSEDGAEMGAFCQLKQPQRKTNLRIRWDEYLPFGLEPRAIYET